MADIIGKPEGLLKVKECVRVKECFMVKERKHCPRWLGGLFLFRPLLASLLCHWLVDRVNGLGFLKVVSLAGGRFICSWKSTKKEGVREWLGLFWLSYC